MTKDVGTQTDNTLFELLDHGYLLYHTDYSKNVIILDRKSRNIQRRSKEICSLNTTIQELKSQKCSLEKIKDAPNAIRFYNGSENYDVLIAVFKCLEAKASRMHFWQRIDNCKDGTFKYQNKNINNSGRQRNLSLLEELFIVLVRFKSGMFLLDIS